MVAELSTGALATLMQGGTVDKPVFQILGIKKIGQNGRYRLHISDGEQACSFAMLATQLNEIVDSGKLDTFAVVRVENQICNFIPPDKRILVILDLTILSPGSVVGQEIGNPKLTKLQTSAAAVPPFHAGGKSGAPTNQPKMFSKPEKSFPTMKPKPNAAGSERVTIPIVALTPYQNRWTIRARVSSKSAIRTWSNSRGEGKLFSMDLMDDTGDIRVTCFNEQCDAFYNMIEQNKVYYISRGVLQPANRQFNKTKSDYEIKFNADSTVEPCVDDADGVPEVTYNFVPIAKVVQHEKDSIIDVIGIVKRCSEVQLILAKTSNKQFQKRDLFLMDTSCTEVSFTLWGQEAENFDGSNNPVVAIRGAKVSDFGGRSLSALNSSVVLINPDMKEALILKKWFEETGCNSTIESISKSAGSGAFSVNWKYMRHVELDGLGTGERADFFTVKGIVVFVRKENCMYKACPTEDCNKKVVDYNNGKYRCEKCNQEFDKFKWRLLLSVNISDSTGHLWVTCFQEMAETMLGRKSAELGDLMESDEEEFQNILDAANFKSFIFKLRSKEDTYNDEKRVKNTVVSVSPVNFVEYNKKLINDFKQLSPAK